MGKITIAVDPGTKASGAAIIDSSLRVLTDAYLVRTRSEDIRDFCSRYPLAQLVIEMPVIRRNSKEMIRDKDILNLATVVGRWMQLFHIDKVQLVHPSTWKGGVGKPVTQRRLLERYQNGGPILSPKERAAIPKVTRGKLTKKQLDDVLDAVGIGMWTMGRYT